MLEETCLLLKPDAFADGCVSKILSMIEAMSDAEIPNIKSMVLHRTPSMDRVNRHVDRIREKHGASIAERNRKFLGAGPILAMCLEGDNVIESVRRLVGNPNPAMAGAWTIRGSLSTDSYDEAVQEDRAVRNLVHASSDADEVEYDLNTWLNGVLVTRR